MNIKESEITIPHHSTPATHSTLANHTLLAKKKKKKDAWCEVIYNGMLVGPQGQFWRRHMMEMNGSSTVEVHGLIMHA